MNRNKGVGILPPVIVCALLNLILFFTVPDARLGCDVFWIAAISILLCTFGGVIPAFRAAKLDPAGALRYE